MGVGGWGRLGRRLGPPVPAPRGAGAAFAGQEEEKADGDREERLIPQGGGRPRPPASHAPGAVIRPSSPRVGAQRRSRARSCVGAPRAAS